LGGKGGMGRGEVEREREIKRERERGRESNFLLCILHVSGGRATF